MRSRLAILRRVLVRCAIWIALFVACIYLCIDAIDARTRATRGPNCQWEADPNPAGVPYSLRWCKSTKDTVLLRLYDAKEKHLLAERSFFQMDRPNFYWRVDAPGYDTRPDGGLISLPPSPIDRLRAKLP